MSKCLDSKGKIDYDQAIKYLALIYKAGQLPNKGSDKISTTTSRLESKTSIVGSRFSKKSQRIGGSLDRRELNQTIQNKPQKNLMSNTVYMSTLSPKSIKRESSVSQNDKNLSTLVLHKGNHDSYRKIQRK